MPNDKKLFRAILDDKYHNHSVTIYSNNLLEAIILLKKNYGDSLLGVIIGV